MYEKEHNKVAKIYNTIVELARDWGITKETAGAKLKNGDVPWMNTKWYVRDYCIGFLVDDNTSYTYNGELKVYQSQEKYQNFISRPSGKLKFYLKSDDKCIQFDSIAKLAEFSKINRRILTTQFNIRNYKNIETAEFETENLCVYSKFE
jgi:hypothetical protein